MRKMRPERLVVTLLLLACGTAASSDTYYVEKTGKDQNTCLSLQQACLTITRASQLATRPHDVVRVGPGDFNERVRITRGGEEGAPVLYTARIGQECPSTVIQDPNSRGERPAPVTTLRGFSIEASYVTIDCFRIVGSNIAGEAGSGVFIAAKQRNITVTNNVVDASQTPGRPWAGVAMKSNVPPAEFSRDITVAKNYIRNTGYGFMIYCGDNCVFADNEVQELKAEGGRGDNDYSRIFGENVTLKRNYFHGNRIQDCIDCHIDCFQSYNVGQIDNIARRIVIDGNTCLGAHQAIIVRDTSSKQAGSYTSHYDWTITNNVLGFGPEGSRSTWCVLFDHVGSVVFEHNLCVANGFAGYLNGTQAIHRFNLHVNTGWKPYGAELSGYTNGEVVATGNLLYRDDGQYVQSQWKGDIVNQQPLFSDVIGRDFRITPRSPARDAAHGSTLPFDKTGQQRPLGSIRDIGPYEQTPTRPFSLPSTDDSRRKR